MIYFLTFILVIGLTFCFEHSKNTCTKLLLVVLIVMILSFLGGSRSPNIGSDNPVYAEFYHQCVNSSLKHNESDTVNKQAAFFPKCFAV